MKLLSLVLLATGWGAPVEVRVDDEVCATYDARLVGDQLVLRVRLGKGWKTFAMDNAVRAVEALKGKKALSADMPTKVTVGEGLTVTGPWKQTPPTDFSKPELRIFTWGYESEAVFVAPVKREGAVGKVGVKGQVCTPSICKNIDVKVDVGLSAGPAEGAPLELVRTQ
jgi:DsbC/DsbD-like thiol-disulfide interchange protein